MFQWIFTFGNFASLDMDICVRDLCEVLRRILEICGDYNSPVSKSQQILRRFAEASNPRKNRVENTKTLARETPCMGQRSLPGARRARDADNQAGAYVYICMYMYVYIYIYIYIYMHI